VSASARGDRRRRSGVGPCRRPDHGGQPSPDPPERVRSGDRRPTSPRRSSLCSSPGTDGCRSARPPPPSSTWPRAGCSSRTSIGRATAGCGHAGAVDTRLRPYERQVYDHVVTRARLGGGLVPEDAVRLESREHARQWLDRFAEQVIADAYAAVWCAAGPRGPGWCCSWACWSRRARRTGSRGPAAAGSAVARRLLAAHGIRPPLSLPAPAEPTGPHTFRRATGRRVPAPAGGAGRRRPRGPGPSGDRAVSA
jgi:hypothetical protein